MTIDGDGSGRRKDEQSDENQMERHAPPFSLSICNRLEAPLEDFYG